MKQNENDQSYKKESMRVVDNKPNGKSRLRCFFRDLHESGLTIFWSHPPLTGPVPLRGQRHNPAVVHFLV
jgi:hypothetical protein